MADTARWAPLVGLPFAYGGRGPDTYDCYGLVMAIHAQQGIALPDYRSPSDQGQIAAIFGNQLPLWREVPRGPDTTVLLRVGRLASHCGYMLDHDRMIHTWKASGGVTIQRLDAWAHRIMGFYRYVGHDA